LWLNNNNGLLYIWQNGEFRLEDTITDEDTTSLTPEGMIQAIDVASRTITAAAVSGNPNASSAADAPDDYFPPSVTGKYSQIIKWIIDKINVLRNRTLNGNGVVIMNGTAVTYSSLATLLSELPNL
jgi:hypothetical protein